MTNYKLPDYVSLVRAIEDLNMMDVFDEQLAVFSDTEKCEAMANELKEAGKLLHVDDPILPDTRRVLAELRVKMLPKAARRIGGEPRVFVRPERIEPIVAPACVKPKRYCGIVKALVSVMRSAGELGLTKEQIFERMHALFPDRDCKKLKHTIDCRLPGRLRRELHLAVRRRGDKFILTD